ncbi:DUF3800 domain-containing protein [Rhizobium indicum]|nr:DUF3800 domain-containing protein [Rhizobium sp. WYCCWR 11152]QKK31373.1 DUF3800 domain-containing protein [Rhizobium indicum]
MLSQTVRGAKWVVDFRPSQTDPCLQLADYCAWAVQRKWERNDLASYDLVRDRISYEYELWKHGKTCTTEKSCRSPYRQSWLSAATPADTAASAYAVVARRVELLPAACVGAVGLPASAGLAKGAFSARSETRLTIVDCA